MKIYVRNARTSADGVRVDRSTPLGNPAKMRGEFDRDRVCDFYAAWIEEQIQQRNPEVCTALNQLFLQLMRKGELSLLCWCSPKRCHAESVARVLARAAAQRGHTVEIIYK